MLLATIGATRILLWEKLFGSYAQYSIFIAITGSLSFVGVILWGTLAGSTLPFIPRLFKMDPASASAPRLRRLSMSLA